jgi:hypothetical protein
MAAAVPLDVDAETAVSSGCTVGGGPVGSPSTSERELTDMGVIVVRVRGRATTPAADRGRTA